MGTARGRGGRPELRELRTPPCGGRRGQRWGRTEGAGLAHRCTTPGHNRSRSVTRSRMRRASRDGHLVHRPGLRVTHNPWCMFLGLKRTALIMRDLVPARGLGRHPRRGQPTPPDALTPHPWPRDQVAAAGARPADQVECPCAPSTPKAPAGSRERPASHAALRDRPREGRGAPSTVLVTCTATSRCLAAARPWPVVSTRPRESRSYVCGKGLCLPLPTNGDQSSPPRASTRLSSVSWDVVWDTEKSSNMWGCP